MPSSSSSSAHQARDWQKNYPFTNDNPFQRSSHQGQKDSPFTNDNPFRRSYRGLQKSTTVATTNTTQHRPPYLSSQDTRTSSSTWLYFPFHSTYTSIARPRPQQISLASSTTTSTSTNVIPRYRVPISRFKANSIQSPLLPTLKLKYMDEKKGEKHGHDSSIIAKENKDQIIQSSQPERHPKHHYKPSQQELRRSFLSRTFRSLCTCLFNITCILIWSFFIIYLIFGGKFNRTEILDNTKELAVMDDRKALSPVEI